MTSSRANSPDRYIGIMKNSEDRCLTEEEKRMILNVYGVLRKEVRLPVKRAIARAADLCGVSTSALFSAKKEFDKNCETKIPNGSLEPLGNVSAQHDENNLVDTRNLSELQPCTTEVCFIVKRKISEMLRISGTATMESLVEAFQKDPQLPNLEATAIRHVVKQLNLTSHFSNNMVPKHLELQQSNWYTSSEATGIRPEDNTNITSDRPTTSVALNDCHIVYCDKSKVVFQGEGKRDQSESVLPDAGEREETDEAFFEFHACASTEVKIEEEEVTDGVKKEVVDADGVFPSRPTVPELDNYSAFDNADGTFPGIATRGTGNKDHSNFLTAQSSSLTGMVGSESDRTCPNTSTGNPEHSFSNVVDTFSATPTSQLMTETLSGVSDQTLPFAGILVYGLNAMNGSNSSPATDLTGSVPNGFHYVGNNVSYDPAGIFPSTPPETVDLVESSTPVPQWRPSTVSSGAKRPRDRRYRSCNACQQMFDRRGPLCHHLGGSRSGKKRSQHPPLVCRYCPRSFPGPGGREFVQHTMYVHTMRSLACEFCSCTFDAAQRLVRHVTKTHMESFLEQQGVVAVLT